MSSTAFVVSEIWMPSVANLLDINWKICNSETKGLWVEIIKFVDLCLSYIQKQGTGVVYMESLLYLTHIIGSLPVGCLIRANC